MRAEIDLLLDRRGGAASRTELLTVLTRNQLDDEVAHGHLVAPFARAYCRPWDADYPPILRRAALISVGQPAALSHVTALRQWRLPTPGDDRTHLTVPIRRHPIGRSPGLVVHRTRVRTRIAMIEGLATVEAAVAVVRSWPMLRGCDQRAPAIEAARRRLVSASDLGRVCQRAPGMRGRTDLALLIAQLDAGCESELELYGYLKVFDVPGLRHGVRQRVVHARGNTYRLDLGYEAERVAVELDGERYHSSRDQRERDRRRDAAMAAIGWLTLRYSHERLHADVDGCRRDTLDALATRRVAA